MVPPAHLLQLEWEEDNKGVRKHKCVFCAKIKLCMLLPDPLVMYDDPVAAKASCVNVSAWCRPCYVKRDYVTLKK